MQFREGLVQISTCWNWLTQTFRHFRELNEGSMCFHYYTNRVMFFQNLKCALRWESYFCFFNLSWPKPLISSHSVNKPILVSHEISLPFSLPYLSIFPSLSLSLCAFLYLALYISPSLLLSFSFSRCHKCSYGRKSISVIFLSHNIAPTLQLELMEIFMYIKSF